MRAPIVSSPASPMQLAIDELTRLAATDAPVLLLGDTGTGKDLMARHVHAHSARADGPFVVVNCAAIPAALIEDELFGQGTGFNRREGRVAVAVGGTLFLDEVAELPAPMQSKLLELLASSDDQRADVRVVVATGKDLFAQVQAGRFRKDLFFRIAVCPITLPPLSERGDDVVTMFHTFLAEAGDARPVDAAVDTALRAYGWPGNVRELKNVVERLRICATGSQISVSDLPATVRAPVAVSAPRPASYVHNDIGFDVDALRKASGAFVALPAIVDEDRAERDGLFAEPVTRPTLPVNLTELLRDLENDYIDAALEQTRGNRQAAAALLGLQRTTLVEKLKRREAGGAGMKAGVVEQRSVV